MRWPWHSGGIYRVARKKILAASPEACWRAITDFDNYPRWQSAIVDAKVTRIDECGRGREVVFELNAMVRTVQFTLGYSYDSPPDKLSWQSLSGDIKKIHGQYLCRPVAESPGGSLVELSFAVQPGIPVPRHIRRVLETVAIEQALDDLEKHAQSFT